jgi:hypothetical protein
MIAIIRITLMSANMTNKTYQVFALFTVLRFIDVNPNIVSCVRFISYLYTI